MSSWSRVLRSFVTQSKKRINFDGTPKLIAFCLQNRRCTQQCDECLRIRSEMHWQKNGVYLPKVIYVPDNKKAL